MNKYSITIGGEVHSVKFKKTSDKDVLDIELKSQKTKQISIIRNAATFRYGFYQYQRGGGYALNIMGYGVSQGDLSPTRYKYISERQLKYMEECLNNKEKMEELYKWNNIYITN